MADILQTTISNAFSWMKTFEFHSLKYIPHMYWGIDKMADMVQTRVSDAFSGMKTIEFHLFEYIPSGLMNTKLDLVQLMAWC